MPPFRGKTITIGRFFEFDVPPKFRPYRWAYSDSQYELRSLTSWDYKFMVDGAFPGSKDRAGPVDEEEQFRSWANIFGSSRPGADVVSRPFGPDLDACTLPCWTFEIQTEKGEYYCGAVVRSPGAVLAIYGSAPTADIVTTLRWLLKTLRTPTASPSDGRDKKPDRRKRA